MKFHFYLPDYDIQGDTFYAEKLDSKTIQKNLNKFYNSLNRGFGNQGNVIRDLVEDEVLQKPVPRRGGFMGNKKQRLYNQAVEVHKKKPRQDLTVKQMELLVKKKRWGAMWFE